MTLAKKILLIMPNLVKPKKKTKVPIMHPVFMNSALPFYAYYFEPDTIGNPLHNTTVIHNN